MEKNKKCWACKRILVGNSKMGLCPDCINKYGSVGAIGVIVGGRQLVKQIIKATKIMKH